MKTPYLDLPKVKGAAHAPWFETWIRQNLATYDYWKKISYQGPEKYSKITVPSLNLTGWFDANFPGSSMNYLGMKKHGATADSRKPRLVIGPWMHIINSRELVGFEWGAGLYANYAFTLLWLADASCWWRGRSTTCCSSRTPSATAGGAGAAGVRTRSRPPATSRRHSGSSCPASTRNASSAVP